MKIKVKLSIGFYGADHEEVIEIDDSDLEGFTEDDKDEYLQEITAEWADNYIEYYYEEIKDDEEEE